MRGTLLKKSKKKNVFSNMLIVRRSKHIGYIEDNKGKLVKRDREKATVLNAFFSSVYMNEKKGYTKQDSHFNTIILNVPPWLTETSIQKK